MLHREPFLSDPSVLKEVMRERSLPLSAPGLRTGEGLSGVSLLPGGFVPTEALGPPSRVETPTYRVRGARVSLPSVDPVPSPDKGQPEA